MELGVALESVNAAEDERGLTFGVVSVPTLVAMNGDEELGRLVGLQSKDFIKSWVEKHCG
jgi:hypothetical protein